MKKLFILITSAFVLSGCSSLPFIGNKQAALQVNSTPTASVYLNGNHVGQSPYFDDKIKPGEYTVRISVEDDPTKDWQTKVTLSPQIVTVVSRDFGNTPDQSSNYLLQLEPLASKSATELSIITIPDNVIVKVDGQPEGFSPVSIKDIAEGDHTVALSAPGYKEQTIQAQTKAGFKLIVSAQLARSAESLSDPSEATDSADLDESELDEETDEEKEDEAADPTPTKKPTPTKSAGGSQDLEPPYVIITETGTGWLRVRAEPSIGSEELTKVDVGDQFPYLDSNETGWYQIEYESGEEGWISGQYADIIEE